MVKRKVIEITLDPDGDISVVPTSCNLDRGQEVQWRIPQASSFVLAFDSADALGKSTVQGQGPASGVERAGRISGVYHYKVVVAASFRKGRRVVHRIFADLYCPTIIIR